MTYCLLCRKREHVTVAVVRLQHVCPSIADETKDSLTPSSVSYFLFCRRRHQMKFDRRLFSFMGSLLGILFPFSSKYVYVRNLQNSCV